MVGLAIASVGFLGALAMVQQAGRLAYAAEEDALVTTGIDQRIDQLRLLEWPEITGTTGITSKVFTARPASLASVTVTQETIVVTAYDVANAKTLTATWAGTSSPTAALTGTGPDLSTASALRVSATLAWTGRRSSRTHSRTLVTIISRGGISKSDLP